VVVALLNVVAVLLVGVCFLVYRRSRRGRPVRRGTRRLSPFAMETAATAFGILSIVIAVTVKIISG
jgi:amino acid transporter